MNKFSELIETYQTGLNKLKQKQILLTDMDDVLTFSSIQAFKLLKQMNNTSLNEYLNFNIIDNYGEVNQRSYYYFTESYNLKPKIPKEIFKLSLSVWDKDEFFEDLQPTTFANIVKSMLNHNILKKVYIISKNLSKEQREKKLKWIIKFFGKENLDKIDFISVGIDETKSKVIKKNKITDWNVYAEDLLDNILDVVINCKEDSFGKEILIPRYGYNQLTNNKAMNYIIDTFNLNVYYYEEKYR